MTCSRDLSIALRCSDRAATLALSHFRRGIARSLESDGTPVTAADLAVERLPRDLFRTEAPDDALHDELVAALGYRTGGMPGRSR